MPAYHCSSASLASGKRPMLQKSFLNPVFSDIAYTRREDILYLGNSPALAYGDNSYLLRAPLAPQASQAQAFLNA
jgi:hypothetical protein